MKYLKFVLAVVLAGIPVGCWAQENVTYATGELQDVLSHLRQSVEALVADNQRLTLQNNALEQEAYQLQTQLSQGQRQEDMDNQTVVRLRDHNAHRAQQISRLEQDVLDLDDRMQKTSEAVKSMQQALQAGYQVNQQLLGQIDQMRGSPHPPEGTSPEVRLQKEKLKLMKMIYDSQRRQDLLHEAILNYEKQAPGPSVQGLLQHQQVLKEQIRDAENQMVNPASNPWDDTQLSALEAQLKELEQNYAQLKSLLGQMGSKLQKPRMSVSQQVEQGQLESNVKDLTRQEAQLRADLEDLRSQMVDLDKRKSSLERLIKQLS